MDCLWFREKLSPNFLSAALPLPCRCGVEVVYSVVGTRTRARHPAPGQVHCLVICIRPATSTAQQGSSLPSEAHTARPLVQCLDRCTSHHLAAGAGAGLGSGHWPAAVHWRCTAQPRHCHEVTCTGWIYACPVLVMKASEVDTNYTWFLTIYTFFIPLLLERTNLNTV